MKPRSLRILIYKGFKQVGATFMITSMTEKEALKYCADVFQGRTCRIEKQKM